MRARNLLNSYYGVADEAAATSTNDDDDLNIDSSAFAVDKYVGTLLQYKSLEELVQRGNAMVTEIKSLDSEMQMLVYENYNKFISATDTIRKMKNRVEDMESQMVELESNMISISAASESVDSSLSARRGQLEKLNGAKKNLTKLQFLMDLPVRLQKCVRDEEHEEAVEDFRRARRILQAVGNVASFQGIEDEATLIMRRLSQALSARLQQPSLTAQSLGATTRLLLQLEGSEAPLLKEYLARQRRALHEVLSTFSTTGAVSSAQSSVPDEPPGDDASPDESGEGTDEGVTAAIRDDGELLPSAATDIAHLGAIFMPQLVELHDEWQRLFMGDLPEPALADAARAPAARLSVESKEAMLLEAVQELTGSFIEMGRRRLQEEGVEPDQLLLGVRKLVEAIKEIDALLPQAKLMQRATRAAEQLARRAMDAQLQQLQTKLAELVAELKGTEAAGGGTMDASLPEQLNAAGIAIAGHVRDALAASSPLLVPLCDLLNLRADGMAKHLVARLCAAMQGLGAGALQPCADSSLVLVRAGLCLQMVSTGVAQVPAMLKAQLSPHGLGGAALGFDSASMTREMQSSADTLLERFVEMQAQKLSLEVTERMHATDWLRCPSPHEVTHLVERAMVELRLMQALASQVLPGESSRSVLPQGPFPAPSSTVQLMQQRTQQASSSSAIQKDLQRMFARKVSLSTAFSATASGKASVAGMLTHVTKLMLKTLVEEVRFGTFSRTGFQQLQLDCAMLRWLLPPFVDDEGAVVALLDEALISCQERCVDPAVLEHQQIEALCEAKRTELTMKLR